MRAGKAHPRVQDWAALRFPDQSGIGERHEELLDALWFRISLSRGQLGLSIHPGESTLIFESDLVLRESHPEFRAPRLTEQYCYRRGHIRFDGVTALAWTDQGVTPAIDAAGEQDLGSFDKFNVKDDTYSISGDLGRIEVVSQPPTVELLE